LAEVDEEFSVLAGWNIAGDMCGGDCLAQPLELVCLFLELEEK
jgi:hypothetical protein